MSENEKHVEKMKRLKTSKQKIFEKKTMKKGLIIVHTGTGKGKSTAAFGMVFRGIAHGMPCAVVQFIKGAMACLLYTSPSPRDISGSRMPSSA